MSRRLQVDGRTKRLRVCTPAAPWLATFPPFQSEHTHTSLPHRCKLCKETEAIEKSTMSSGAHFELRDGRICSRIFCDHFGSPHGEFYFLSHAHTDHMIGLSVASFDGTIHCSPQTHDLLLVRFPALRDRVRIIDVDTPTVMFFNDMTTFTVTLFDANHCPGSVMFLFEGNFGYGGASAKILHTGDFRFDAERMPPRLACAVGADCVIVDATFGDATSGKFPTKRESAEKLYELLASLCAALSTTRIYLPFKLGDEELVEHVCQRLGCKIFVDAASDRCKQWLQLESMRCHMTHEANETLLHVASFKRPEFSKRYEAPGVYFVCTSTQWKVHGIKDTPTQRNLLYSMHSGMHCVISRLINLHF